VSAAIERLEPLERLDGRNNQEFDLEPLNVELLNQIRLWTFGPLEQLERSEAGKREGTIEGQIFTFDITPCPGAKCGLRLSLLGNCVCPRSSIVA
jgi:hypothetical protein